MLLWQKAERAADLIHHVEVARTRSQHENDCTERAFGPAAQYAAHTPPPVLEPALHLAAITHVVVAPIAIDRHGAPILLLSLQFLVGGGGVGVVFVPVGQVLATRRDARMIGRTAPRSLRSLLLR
eukprot:1500958-Prymnesium_polylepis.1